MKYIVELDYDEYEFEDGTTALSWAEIAVKTKRKKREYPKDVKIILKHDEGGDSE